MILGVARGVLVCVFEGMQGTGILYLPLLFLPLNIFNFASHKVTMKNQHDSKKFLHTIP